MTSFAVGLGGTLGVYCAEIVPIVGFGIASFMQWMSAAMIGKVLPFFIDWIGPTSLTGVFVAFLVLGYFFVDFACEETKGLSPSEIDSVFSKKFDREKKVAKF